MKAKNTKPYIEKDILTDLYVTKRMTSYEIAEVLQITRKTITKYLKEYEIAINPKQRKYELIKKVPFTKEQKEMIFGTMLGDGCIHPHGRKNKSYALMIGHCEKQKDLVMWKKIILGNLVNVVNKRVDKRGNSTMYCFTSVVHNEFKQIYDLFYENGKKIIKDEMLNYITPFGLAVWIMDDGGLVGRGGVNLRLSTDGFSEGDNKKLQQMLRLNFGLNSKIGKYTRHNKEYCYLSLNKENTIKATKLTEKYFVDCMKYKLYKEPSTTKNNDNTGSDIVSVTPNSE